MHAIGIDIGGTKIAGALVDESGTIIRTDRRPSPAVDPSEIEDVVVAMITSLAEDEEVIAAGITAAGFIDSAQSTVYYAPNINWRNERFREKLETRLDLPIIIENDANAAGWAEFRYGAGRHYSDMVTLTIGTGVGLGAVLDPQVFVFGGGVAAARGLLLDPIRAAYLDHLPARGYHPEAEFAIAELVNDAGVVGAADLAREHVKRVGRVIGK